MEHYDIVVIGSGSGNTILDEDFADRRAAIIDSGAFGGTCLNVGCIPTTMFVLAVRGCPSGSRPAVPRSILCLDP